ncbi:PRC-barrel domain-containing protein [Oceanirhabdus sp. W0125-5]|uniref:PRC-barrel domain-containing protein n=1 Tax=Oceanirhabdus sp. W0125-5 TaxID=2999116 RepID=UPI0022F2DFE3|nr:PRC-barrel domain-containing protein [Oceanirhabdus sp. W0125-5]WBW99605.1 PRC-barrel domain-containing protein [Oceanirhabdus sp. W0125-5]
MYRKYDFMSMEIYNLKGKRLGTVNDICFNFSNNTVVGFLVESAVPFKKNGFIHKNDVIYFNDNMIVKEFGDKDGIPLKSILNMDVYNLDGHIVGIVSDVIIDKELRVVALALSSGLLKDFFEGRRIISAKRIILGEENLIYYGKERIIFRNLAHL